MHRESIFFAGPPGCGKGTQSKNLSKETGYVHISTGDLCRSEVKRQTQIGKAIDANMAKGILAPDDVIFELIEQALDENYTARGFIFDGFPRTQEQSKRLIQLMRERNMKGTVILQFKVKDEVCIERMKGRADEAVEKRSDDSDEVYIKRLQDYKDITVPAIELLQQSGIQLIEIDGHEAPRTVFTDIQFALQGLLVA